MDRFAPTERITRGAVGCSFSSMPVTPFHFGPGLLLKAVLGRRMSFGTFVLVQCAIDVESVANILLDRWPVHDHLHTMVGALAVAAVVAVASRRPLTSLNEALRARGPDDLAGRYLSDGISALACRLNAHTKFTEALRPLSWSGAFSGAALGAITHVLLDGVIHLDMAPFGSWLATNPLLVDESFLWMHLGCAIVGVVTLLLWPWLSKLSPSGVASQ
jgi:hypothetical protein